MGEHLQAECTPDRCGLRRQGLLRMDRDKHYVHFTRQPALVLAGRAFSVEICSLNRLCSRLGQK